MKYVEIKMMLLTENDVVARTIMSNVYSWESGGNDRRFLYNVRIKLVAGSVASSPSPQPLGPVESLC